MKHLDGIPLIYGLSKTVSIPEEAAENLDRFCFEQTCEYGKFLVGYRQDGPGEAVTLLVIDTTHFNTVQYLVTSFLPPSQQILLMIADLEPDALLAMTMATLLPEEDADDDNSPTRSVWYLHRIIFTDKGLTMKELFCSADSSEGLSLPHNFKHETFMWAGLYNRGRVFRALTGNYDWRLHEVHLDSGSYSHFGIHPEPAELPWIFPTGCYQWQNRVFCLVRSAGGESSSPEFVLVVNLEKREATFVPSHPDPDLGFPMPRCLAGVIGFKHFLFVSGGLEAVGDPLFDRPFTHPLEDTWSLNLQTLSWKRLPTAPTSAGVQEAVLSPASGKGVISKICKEATCVKGRVTAHLHLREVWTRAPPLESLALERLLVSRPDLVLHTGDHGLPLGIRFY